MLRHIRPQPPAAPARRLYCRPRVIRKRSFPKTPAAGWARDMILAGNPDESFFSLSSLLLFFSACLQ